MRNGKHNGGFSLIESLIAMVLVACAVVSLLAANGAFTKANGIGTDLSTAEFLVEQIRELSAVLAVVDPETETATFGFESGETLATYDDLDDFDGASFSPPIGADRSALAQLAGFSQQVTVQNVNPSNFEQVAADHSTAFVRVTVRVFLNSQEISSASWLRTRY